MTQTPISDERLREIFAEELDRQTMHQAADDIRNGAEGLADSGAVKGMYHDKLLFAALAAMRCVLSAPVPQVSAANAATADIAGLVERLRAGADDPMWADHAEFPKRILRQAVYALLNLSRENAAQAGEIAGLIEERNWANIEKGKAQAELTRLRASMTEPTEAQLTSALRALNGNEPDEPFNEIDFDQMRAALKALQAAAPGVK